MEYALTKDLDFWVTLRIIRQPHSPHDVNTRQQQSEDQEYNAQKPKQLGNNDTVVRFEHLRLIGTAEKKR